MEDHVLRAQHAMTVFRIKEKLTLIVEDHALRVHLAMTAFKIKKKPALIVEDHVLHAKVWGLGQNDMSIIQKILDKVKIFLGYFLIIVYDRSYL